MRKALSSLFIVLSMAVGMVVLSACSNHEDDERDAPLFDVDDEGDAGTTSEEAVSDSFTDAVDELNAKLSGLDFNELTPLAITVEKEQQALQQETRAAGDVHELLSVFQQKLSSLISLLRGGDISLRVPYGVRFNYESFNQVLDLSWEIAGTLEAGREGSTYFLGKHTNAKGEAEYVSNDGSVFTISAVYDKDVNIRNWSHTIASARMLTINKDGEQLLKIVTDNESDRPLYNPFKVRETMAGEIVYRDYDIVLAYDHSHTHERYASLTYGKVDDENPLIVLNTKVSDDGSFIDFITHNAVFQADFEAKALNDMLVVKGVSNNVNWLVLDSVHILKCLNEGTTEEECQHLADDLNANLSLALYLADAQVCNLYLSSLYDAATDSYKPTVMIHSVLLDGHDYDLASILASLGITVGDILSIGKLID